ncbi:MAG: TlpA family protein disulfide reductase, partial [Gemmataceae bacterium]
KQESPIAPTLSPGDGPTAALGSPIIKNPPNSGITIPLPPSGDSSLSVGSRNMGDVSLIAEGKQFADEGLTREIPSPKVTIPSFPSKDSPGRKSSSPPPSPPLANDPGSPGIANPASTGIVSPGMEKSEIPETKTAVPSCVRVGNRIQNFALNAEKGGIYEYSKEPAAKVTLIDFWFTACPPCRSAIPHLNTLQNKYGRYGLQIIGVAYEQGSLEEKKQAIQNGRQKYRLSFQYPILIGGGGDGPCPLAEQLEVQRFPTLVLLDETGKILFRCQGLDSQNSYELEMAIRKQLFPRQLASP